MNRDPSDVINKVLAVVPKTESALISRLVAVREAGRYRAPEASGYTFRELGFVLNGSIGKMVEPWHFEVARIVRGEQ